MYSFYTSYNDVTSINFLAHEMSRKEVENDDDPDRDYMVPAACIAYLMLRHKTTVNACFGVNANGHFEELVNTPVLVAVESWDYVLTITEGYRTVSVKNNRYRNDMIQRGNAEYIQFVNSLTS